uniref:Sodium/hydrogen exchanger n=1 Tax=Pundamilia nyererei TaxID=303518 RepID=A0A3B4F6X6_9CICH
MLRCGYALFWLLGSVLLICVVSPVKGEAVITREGSHLKLSESSHSNESQHGHSSNVTGIPIISFKWHHVETPYLVAFWVLVSFLGKLVIEANHQVTSIIPESALLICFGFILGGMIWAADKVQTFRLTPTVFFFYLLPQVILDAGYHMPNKLFFTNLGGILVHAVIGTCWNAASLGLSLWGCQMGGAMGDLDIGLLQYLLFGSLMAAVDPVAVIAVFEQVHVNDVLFIMVFGESLLNDGVTVVLFNVFDAFVSLGGPKIDAIIEPGFIFVLGYLSYLTAEMLSLSAILSIVFCGMCCQKYINANMDENSVQTVRYAMKAFANGSETIIFVFLGISAIDKVIWVWNTGFILLTLLFVLVYRFIGVFFLTWILNRYRLVPLEFVDQVIMSYGGLRGAVAYGLAVMLDENKIKEKNLMVCTTLIVVYFTVILQGITMKPLVMWLKVKRAAVTEVSLLEKLTNKMFNHALVAIEDISGQIGHNYMRSKTSLGRIRPETASQDILLPRRVEAVIAAKAVFSSSCLQHRHRFSRSHFDINRDEKEVQEIFQRTMRNRLKSFTSAKMGVKPPKTIVKHTQKEQQQKLIIVELPNSAPTPQTFVKNFQRTEAVLNLIYVHRREASSPKSVSFVHPAGIENPAFMPDLDPMDLLQIPPWLGESELDSSMVALSHRAQVDLPRTPSNLRRLAPLRISTRSTDSFTLENIPDTQQMDTAATTH